MANTQASSELASSWDLAAFEQKVIGDTNWSINTRIQTKQVTRVQDLALSNLDSSVHSVEPKGSNNTWPFESSPCRMFGGKKTRAGANQSAEIDQKNEQLFDRNFADHASPTKFENFNEPEDDEPDEETSIEDENVSEDDDQDDDFDEDETVGDTDSFCGDKSTDGSRGSLGHNQAIHPPQSLLNNHTRQRTSVIIHSGGSALDVGSESEHSQGDRRAMPVKQHPSQQQENVKQPSSSAKPPRKGDGASKETRRRTRQLSSASRKSEGSGSASAPAVSPAKQERKPSRLKTLKKEKSSSSLMNRKKSKRAGVAEDGLNSTSFHGGSPPPRTTRRRGINRAKSSDGMEGMMQGRRGGSSRDGPGGISNSVHSSSWNRKGRKRHEDSMTVGSAHTSASYGRSKERSSSRRGHARSKERNVAVNSGLDRRGTLTRAMSTTNVKRPEEYGGAHQVPHEDPSSTRSTMDHKLKRGSSSRSLSSREREKDIRSGAEDKLTIREQTSVAGEGADPASVSIEQSKGRPKLRRKSSTRLNRTGSGRSLASAGGSPTGKLSSKQQQQQSSDTLDGQVTSEDAPGNDSIAFEETSVTVSPKRSKSSKRSTRERRDLMDLLRERETIKQSDLMDKENRRLLHFLMYEHKMGISQKELIRRIREEKESS